jgi:translation initiation factor 1
MNIDDIDDDTLDSINIKVIVQKPIIHLRIQQRNGRKSVTIVENIEVINIDNNKEFMKRITTYFKKTFNCSVCIKEDNVIQLQGDQRAKIKEFIIKRKLAKEDDIVVHGA